ncbi:NAD(P)-bd-dom domain-containing protein [Fusarium sp. LHS14.1]|nr:NAD(P)-bd-dom domain-containing protein [Fusarium sp. LHS14.1]
MKVAIAGLGDVSRYLLEELPKEGHSVVALTRSLKPHITTVEQRVTDYSVLDLKKNLADCDAIVSAITIHAPEFASIHLAILQACKVSPKCKRFLPSAWAGNYEEVNGQPLYAGEDLLPILEALRAQKDVYWTFFCQGWMVDYILPSNQRHLADFGERWVQNYETKVFTLYGNGAQKVDFTSARDTTHAVGVLLNDDPSTWEEFTCVSGQQMTWRELWEFVKAREPEYTLQKKSLAQSIKQFIAKRSQAEVAASMYEVMGHSDALAFPDGKVERHREKFFKSMKFRTPAELYDEAVANPGVVV